MPQLSRVPFAMCDDAECFAKTCAALVDILGKLRNSFGKSSTTLHVRLGDARKIGAKLCYRGILRFDVDLMAINHRATRHVI